MEHSLAYALSKCSLNGLKGFFVELHRIRTEVVLTPQSTVGVVGLGAGGVSTHSKVSSEAAPFILDMVNRLKEKLFRKAVGNM